MCQANHWNLLVICNLDLEFKSDRSPCMLLLDSLHAADPEKHEPCIKQFLLDIYENENDEIADEVFNIPLKIPKVPQQQNGSKCGYYVLYYMYKFLLSCPEHFNLEEHYPGFMDENWFTNNEVEEFSEKLPLMYKNMVEDEEFGNTGDAEDSGIRVYNGSNEREGASIELFEPSDALRALVIYTPDSSQEIPKTVLQTVECDKEDTPAAAEEILTQSKNEKQNSVTFITKSDFYCQKKGGGKLKIKIRAEKKSAVDMVGKKTDSKYDETQSQKSGGKKKRDSSIRPMAERRSPRFVVPIAKSNDGETRSSVEDKEPQAQTSTGKEKKGLVSNADIDFQITPPKKWGRKGANELEKPPRSQDKKRKAQDQARTSVRKGKKVLVTDADSDFEVTPPRKLTRKGANKLEKTHENRAKKRKAQVQVEETKGKKHKFDKSENKSRILENGMPEELKIRAYPSTFTKVVSEMTNAQKKWVIEA